VLFLGSGLGREAVPSLKTGNDLCEDLTRELGVLSTSTNLPELLQYLKNQEAGSDRPVRNWLETSLLHRGVKTAEPGGAHFLTLALPSRRILTTNFDLLLDRAASIALPASDWFATSSCETYDRYSREAPRTAFVCGKIHGSFHPAEVTDIVATTDDYIDAYQSSPWREWLRQHIRTERIVFVGYSLRDFTTWTSYFSSILDFRRETWPHSLVAPSQCQHELKFWINYNIQYVPLKAHEFLIATHQLLGTLERDNNPVHAAAALWMVKPEEARAPLKALQTRFGYPNLGLTIQRVILDSMSLP
jgi:hypothetical protein